MAKSKRPADPNIKAKIIVDIATGEIPDPISYPVGKNPYAVALGRLGGLKGGKARAEKLSSDERRRIAMQAAKVRWSKVEDD